MDNTNEEDVATITITMKQYAVLDDIFHEVLETLTLAVNMGLSSDSAFMRMVGGRVSLMMNIARQVIEQKSPELADQMKDLEDQMIAKGYLNKVE